MGSKVISVGDKIPKNEGFVMGALGIEAIDTVRLFKGKKVILTGVPAAFSPTCSEKHIPDYLKHFDTFKECGVDSIICLAVNDAYVLSAWDKKMGGEGRMIMFSDFQAKLSKSIGLTIDLSAAGLGVRSLRFAMVVERSKVTYLAVDDASLKYQNTGVAKLLKFLKA